MRDVRLPLRSVAAAGVVAAVTASVLAGQVAASAAAGRGAARPAGGPGHWTQVSAQTSNIADVGLVRGADGVLHVLWQEGTIAGHEGILDTPIAGSGAVGHSTVIVSGQSDANFPDATATPSGLDVFWGGVKSLPGAEGVYAATRPARGGHWTVGSLIPENVPPGTISAGTASDGKPWISYTGTFFMNLLHLGQKQDTVSSACCTYNTKIATDGKTGISYVGYLSLIPGAEGVWLHRLSSNAVTGKAFRLPGSVTRGNTIASNQRIAITGRGRGRPGVFVSYGVGWPSYTAVDLYKVGASKPFTLAAKTSGEEIAETDVTAGPDGRLWDVWIDGDGTPAAMFVRASNPAVTAWTTTSRVALPKGTSVIWKVYESAQAGKTDVVALMTVNGHTAYYATQAPLPPMPK